MAQSQDKFKLNTNENKIKIDIFAWLIFAIGLAIIFGILMLVWLGWSFQSQSSRQNLDDLGMVPVQKDFAIGEPKRSDVLFRIAGTSRLGEKLFPDLVVGFLGQNGYTGVGVSKSNRITTINGSKGGKSYRVLIYSGSANGGFEAMMQGRVEAVMSSRPVEPSEADRLSAFGDMNSFGNEKIVGHDASFVYVNNSNSLSNLNGDILNRILTGEVKKWEEVSQNESGDIKIIIESLGGNELSTSLSRVIDEKELIDSVKTYNNPSDVLRSVSVDGDAIGISHSESKLGGVKSLTLHERNARSFDPTDFNIATEAYAFTERVYLYVATNGTDNNAASFGEFVTSQKGQEIVQKAGFGAQIAAPFNVPAPLEAPIEYKSFSQNSQRMNFDFRFQSGANTLDSKAVEDEKRLVAYLRANNIPPARLALFGFADNVGARETNIGLAQSRAEVIAQDLAQMGYDPALVRSFGDAMPVGANAFEQGRVKNRRVEVWICGPPACPLLAFSNVPAATKRAPQQQGIPSGVRLGRPKATPEGETVPRG